MLNVNDALTITPMPAIEQQYHHNNPTNPSISLLEVPRVLARVCVCVQVMGGLFTPWYQPEG